MNSNNQNDYSYRLLAFFNQAIADQYKIQFETKKIHYFVIDNQILLIQFFDVSGYYF